ncbi:MAG: ATP-binding cassette domain-containing protein, partial [Burkholderiales bacterium]|nr:ATP-binding cassette domain-containing protein [Burkholderiales bacterium]
MFEISNFSFSYPFSQYKIGFNGDFKIQSGQCILITGDSGSGKSTLLQALKGLIPNHINGNLSGEIWYKSKLIQSFNENELIKIGYLQQNPDHQIICNTVFDELAFGLENLQLDKNSIEKQIFEITDRFNISHILQRKINTLSGGEKQRINLLAILLMNPDVLLLDEPTAFLDPESAHEIIDILKKYIHNKTVVIIEHNAHYLSNFVDYVVNINKDGQIKILDKDTISIQQIQIKKHNYIPNTILDIRNLSFSYKNTIQQLLMNINLNLHTGEIISIYGKNGAGKSTLLKLISKVIKTKQQVYYK